MQYKGSENHLQEKMEDSDTFWSYEEAKSKCDERYSCFVEVEAQEHMSLSPYYIGRIKQGVQEKIERRIRRWKFVEEHEGIIVAYDNIKLLQRSAEIYDDSPFLHFDIKVNYIVFKPEVGKKLVGVVNKTSSTHVGCLVHGHFNASLALPKTCKNGWIGDKLDVGTEFIFRVADLQTAAGVLLIAGHIKDKDVKHIRSNESTSVDDSKAQDVKDSESSQEEGHSSKKKKKKSKHRSLNSETSKKDHEPSKTVEDNDKNNNSDEMKEHGRTQTESKSKRNLSSTPAKKHKKKIKTMD